MGTGFAHETANQLGRFAGNFLLPFFDVRAVDIEAPDAGDEPVHAHGAQQAPRIGNVGRERNDDADPVNQVRDYVDRGPERGDDGNGDREPRAIDARIERVTLDDRVVAVLRRPHDLPDEGRRRHRL